MLLKAIEEKTFYPFGSDRQVSSDFQLIAGTVRDLRQLVAERQISRRSVRADQSLDLHPAGTTPAPGRY
ncbi:sigma 54-interacting transcriptional regulator [Escherichia coli]